MLPIMQPLGPLATNFAAAISLSEESAYRKLRAVGCSPRANLPLIPFSGSSCQHMESPVLVGLSDNWLRGAASQIVDDGGRTSHPEDRLRYLAGVQWPIKKESLG
jgi:hypothetical protein